MIEMRNENYDYTDVNMDDENEIAKKEIVGRIPLKIGYTLYKY